MGIILGYADLALDDIPKENPARRNIDKILKASRRAKDLVKQILLFSRQETQNLSPLQPDPIIRESIKLLRSTIPVKGSEDFLLAHNKKWTFFLLFPIKKI